MKKVKQFSTSKFQYISCYCLSVLYKRKKLGTTTFQYISCYCLSSCSSNRDINTSNFNTSHVTVYPITIDTKRFQFCDFNTSHSILIGSVPTDEELENANMIAGSIPLKNFNGLIPPIVFTANEYTTTAWMM